jgi:hypothetical protein
MENKTLLGPMLLYALVSVLVCGVHFPRANASEPRTVEWTRVYGGSGLDVAHAVIQTSDGGFLLMGGTESFGAGARDFWLVKTDVDGNVEWNQTYGGPRADNGFSVVETSDGGFALAGFTRSFGAGGQDGWLVKTDVDGNVEWNQTYGGPNNDNLFSVVGTSDGGFALAGFTLSYGAVGEDFWLVKTDSSGNREWHKRYGGSSIDIARSVVEADDGSYLLAGSTESFGAGVDDFWLVKVDSSGNHEWNRTYGGSNSDYAFSTVGTSDGGYAIGGRTRSFGSGGADFWLVKVDSSGNHEWNQTYGGTGNDPAHTLVEASLAGTVDGGYVLAGFTVSFGAGGQDGWLVKTDVDGNMEWNQTYGGTYDDVINSVTETSDKGYVLAGFTLSLGTGAQDFWLVKLAAPPEYTIGIDSSPDSVTFTVNSVSHVTPWTGSYEEDTSVILEMPEIHVSGSSRYYWSKWSDEDASRSREIVMSSNISLEAQYTGPHHELTIDSLPTFGITFTVNGIPKTTPFLEWLIEDSYTVVLPETYGEYSWSHWLEDGDANRIKVIELLDTATYTAVYKPTIVVGGSTVNIESGQATSWAATILTLFSVVLTAKIYIKRLATREQSFSNRYSRKRVR